MFNALALALTARQNNPEKRAMLPKMAFSGFKSRYREPKVDEGFEETEHFAGSPRRDLVER